MGTLPSRFVQIIKGGNRSFYTKKPICSVCACFSVKRIITKSKIRTKVQSPCYVVRYQLIKTYFWKSRYDDYDGYHPSPPSSSIIIIAHNHNPHQFTYYLHFLIIYYIQCFSKLEAKSRNVHILLWNHYDVFSSGFYSADGKNHFLNKVSCTRERKSEKLLFTFLLNVIILIIPNSRSYSIQHVSLYTKSYYQL